MWLHTLLDSADMYTRTPESTYVVSHQGPEGTHFFWQSVYRRLTPKKRCDIMHCLFVLHSHLKINVEAGYSCVTYSCQNNIGIEKKHVVCNYWCQAMVTEHFVTTPNRCACQMRLLRCSWCKSVNKVKTAKLTSAIINWIRTECRPVNVIQDQGLQGIPII